jgi:ABC-type uncharacterized transport system permease subunit
VNRFDRILIPLAAIVLAFLIGFLIIGFSYDFATAAVAFRGLFDGAFGTMGNLSEVLVKTTPYILSGLAVAIGFRCGLFNIGVEGQMLIGSLFAVYVGYRFSLPAVVHLPLAMFAGIAGGALYALIPAWLKVKTGAHEVINTIMLNYVAYNLVDFLVNRVLKDGTATIPRTPFIAASAHLPTIVDGYRLHYGFFLAIMMALLLHWFLKKTIYGYEIQVTGANSDAARYGGVNTKRTTLMTMAMSGGLAGLAGAIMILGVNHNLPAAFSGGYGFDAIAVALLAKSSFIGILPSAFLWGVLRVGASTMQIRSQISVDMINIIQALVIMFIAADTIIRFLLRIKSKGDEEIKLSSSWGS